LILSNISFINGPQYPAMKILSLVLLLIGLIFTFVSLINLGKSTRLGLPSEDTTLKTNGIYRFSRNPMYLGFSCFTLAAIIHNINIITIIFGIYIILIHHFIILGEERFLENRFGKIYINYKNKVRRYI